MANLVRSTTSFAFMNVHNIQEVITPDQLFDADDPIVRAHPDMFTPVVATAGVGRVEQATASPGERRNVLRPR